MTVIDTEELLYLLNRRRFLIGSAALAAAPFMPWQALAQTAPHSFKMGDAEITVVSDGSLTLPLNIMAPEAAPEQLAEIAKRLGWGENAQPAANPVLVRIGSDLILIDNGSGSGFQPTAGKLAENLKAAGIDAAAITKVVISHAHPDHLGGTLGEGGSLRYPNAAYYVGETEWNFWTDPELINKMPAEMAEFVKGAQRDLAAVKDRVTMIKGGQEVVTGLSAIDTPGHTPGHLSFFVAGGEGLIVTADATPNELISFEHPDWKFGFDADPMLAIQSRKALVDRAAADKNRMIGFHWAYPGVGYAEKKDAAYVFTKAA